ncbi:uncharacterized protein LOC119455960 [Dermacentor silvarum]|uniref:uncharacterized protein LOC119455960 n=1 Tax=Dermacentor silvarum TaxID=543639 RepID=UPI0021008DED|nr:uncharacterized protein LOC119455960 [Dermacentor silvarum]
MDLVHPSFVTAEYYTGKVTWIKSVLEEHSVCLPIARVTISGPFGELETDAGVSKALPMDYPHLFSEHLLRERAQEFGEGRVQELTRSRARQIAAQLTEDPSAAVAEREEAHSLEPRTTEEKENSVTAEAPLKMIPVSLYSRSEVKSSVEITERESSSVLSPASWGLDMLLQVDRESLSAEQQRDQTLTRLHYNAKEGIARRNVTIEETGGLLYRHYRDRRGRILDQLIVPERYRADLLTLCHGNGWSGHLGINKTKERLLLEYYWPGCFRDVENYVRPCDTCKRVQKP